MNSEVESPQPLWKEKNMNTKVSDKVDTSVVSSVVHAGVSHGIERWSFLPFDLQRCITCL